jgi:hypothetical protein
MVARARQTGRLEALPAPGPTPFADAALELHGHGLAPIPLGGDDGKKPLVKYRRYSRRSLEQLIRRHPTANVGILTGLSEVTVVDVDDPELVDPMVDLCGYTPLRTSTPSGGQHLWYRADGEHCRVRLDDRAVDIRGVGGMVVVPPSIRPSGSHAGKAYTFVAGSWNDLRRLKRLKPDSLREGPAIKEGRRNTTLLRYLLAEAPSCDDVNGLLDVAHTWNSTYVPPLPDAEVDKTGRQAWKYQVEGHNWLGRGAYLQIAERTFDRLLAYDRKRGPDALALYHKLQAKNAARDRRRETFAVAARAMARDKVLPWTEKRIRQALRVLVDFDLLELVQEGGHGEGDAHQYRFRSPPPVLVSKKDTNVTKRRPPRPLSDGRAARSSKVMGSPAACRVPALEEDHG